METIHDKRVSVFLPLPSFIQRERALRLVQQARGVSRKLTRSFSVVWEAPLCVAALKLGKVDQSLDQVRREMASVEKSFRSIHDKFLSDNLRSSDQAEPTRKTRELLVSLAGQFPRAEARTAKKETSKFLERQNGYLVYLLESAFGDVWTLELSPDDYRRIRRELFPSLVAEEVGASHLGAELERFKKHTIVGLDSLARLSSEQGKESSLVAKNVEQYQATAFIDPVMSRLLFIGRTEGVERSIIWIGGLFLYQAWIGCVSEALYESAIGLRSINQATYGSPFGRLQISKLSESELLLISRDFDGLEQLRNTVIEAMARIRSSYQSAKNFHDTLTALLEDQNFDIGLYRPILLTNQEHLKSLDNKIGLFEEEFGRAFDQFGKVNSMLRERSKRVTETDGQTPRELPSFPSDTKLVPLLSAIGVTKTKNNKFSPTFYLEVKRLFGAARLVYPVVLESDIVI